MRVWIITGVLIAAVFLTVAVYACIIAASKADRREEETERRRYHDRH